MPEKNETRIWEPATWKQKNYFLSLANEAGLTETDIMERVQAVTGLRDLETLSKNEVGFLIDRLKGTSDSEKPYPPRKADRIEGDTSNMPRAGHVEAILDAFRALEWGPERYWAWMRERLKVYTLAELDMDGAKSGYLQLTEILKARN